MIALWGLVAAFGASYGYVAAGTLAGQIVVSGVEDPVNEPDLWNARSEGDHGPIIWEGTRAELDAIIAEGRSAYQADLRETRLYPAVAVTFVGLALLAVDITRRRRAEH